MINNKWVKQTRPLVCAPPRRARVREVVTHGGRVDVGDHGGLDKVREVRGDEDALRTPSIRHRGDLLRRQVRVDGAPLRPHAHPLRLYVRRHVGDDGLTQRDHRARMVGKSRA